MSFFDVAELTDSQAWRRSSWIISPVRRRRVIHTSALLRTHLRISLELFHLCSSSNLQFSNGTLGDFKNMHTESEYFEAELYPRATVICPRSTPLARTSPFLFFLLNIHRASSGLDHCHRCTKYLGFQLQPRRTGKDDVDLQCGCHLIFFTSQVGNEVNEEVVSHKVGGVDGGLHVIPTMRSLSTLAGVRRWMNAWGGLGWWMDE